MKKNTKAVIVGAAMTGLFAGSFAVRAHAANVSANDAGKSIHQMGDKDGMGCGGKEGCKGKHDCKGKNDCKGQGGCKTDSNSCKGKNDCKGKGGCNTNKPM